MGPGGCGSLHVRVDYVEEAYVLQHVLGRVGDSRRDSLGLGGLGGHAQAAGNLGCDVGLEVLGVLGVGGGGL